MSRGCRGSAWPEPIPTIRPQAAVNGRCSATFFIAMTTRATASHANRRPKKSLGQHFLIDPGIANRIVAAAALAESDTVIEVGPGTGILTRRLVRQAGVVVAVELDSRLAQELPSRLGEPNNLVVHNEDARNTDPNRLLDPATAYKVVANLPYYAAAPIIRHFLEANPAPNQMVVMVQREVGEAMTAVPGSMTLMSVATQFYARASVVTQVPPRAFRPPPKVSSTVVKLDVHESPYVEVGSTECFFDLVRAGFAAPRKQLRNSLMQGTGASADVVTEMLTMCGIDGQRRPATLSMEEWCQLDRHWSDEIPRHKSR